MRVAVLGFVCVTFVIWVVPTEARWSRPRPDGLVDDFEGKFLWRARADGGHCPRPVVVTDRPHGGKRCLRLEYRDAPPHWGSIEKRIAITGRETALTLWLRVEKAAPKAAMHIWLMEKDGDGWLARVRLGDRTTLADFPKGWVRVRIPMSEFKFQPRGRRTPDLPDVAVIVLNFNYGDSTVYLDDIAFEVPTEVRKMLLAAARRDEKRRQAVLARVGWKRSAKGNVAVFADDVPAPDEGTPSDPKYLAEVLRRAGYSVSLLAARDMATPGVLSPSIFDLVVLPYGPRFPSQAAEAFREYLADGGRFISVGGYAFDEPYFADRHAGKGALIDNGGFEKPAAGHPGRPAGWVLPAGAGVHAARVLGGARSGAAALRIATSPEAPTWTIARWRIDHLDTSATYHLEGYVRASGFPHGKGAYLAADFYRADGTRISFVQTTIIPEARQWQQVSVEFTVPASAAYMTVNCVVYGVGEAWFDDVQLRAVPQRLNARVAKARDMLHISEDQIAIFDPAFRLKRVAQVRAAKGQFVVPADLRLPGPVAGYAAVGLWGQNNPVFPKPYARWIPLLRAYDQYGHLRGTVGAVMFHHAGPWEGSVWAFFGATDRDLFRRGDAKMADVLVRLVRHMLRGIYLSCPEPGYMCYRDGEIPAATVLVGNNGLRRRTVEVRAELFEADSGRMVAASRPQTLSLEPGDRRTVEFSFRRFNFAADLYRVRFTASVNGEAVDTVSTGFCVWRDDVLARGPDVRWRDNYFHLGADDAGRFLLGTNQTGVVLGPWWENPLAWRREFQYMHDWGLRVLRVLHISHFARDLTRPDEKFLRRLDALVYMAQRNGLAVFACMHDWLGGITIPDGVLETEAQFAKTIAGRYRNVPGFIIDIENEAHVVPRDDPQMRAMFNDFLRQVYHGDERALQKTWGQDARFGKVPFKWPPKNTPWDDLRWLDVNLFRRRLVARWMRANVEAMRQADRRHAITDEYYLLPGGDAGRANKYCDFVNIHCYTIDRPEQLKYYDHSAEGMGFAVGEFSRRSHPSFVHGWGWAPEPEVRRWYIHLIAACLGGGGSMACNWDWKDMESCIFPWGLVYPCDLVPKGQFYVMRAMAEALGRLRLTYAPPSVYVVIPDLHVLGAPDDAGGWPPALRCIAALLKLRVPFGVLHDTNLDKLPPAAKVIFYPSAFCLSDETFAALKRFVSSGGVLYVSGDISYEQRRKRSRPGRLAELCGVEDAGALYRPDQLPSQRPLTTPRAEGLGRYPAVACVRAEPASAEVLAEAGGLPALLENRLGAGRVIYSTAPLELFDDAPPATVYRLVLRRAGVQPLAVEGDDGRLIFMLPPQRTGRLAVVFRDDSERAAEISLLGCTVRIAPRNWAIVATDASGEPYLVCGQGRVSVGDLQLTASGNDPLLVFADRPLSRADEFTLICVPVTTDAYDEVPLQTRWRGAQRPRFEAGEIVEGRWRTLQMCPAQRRGDGWTATIPNGSLVRVRGAR